MSSLYTVPFRISKTHFSVVVVLTEENLTRMRGYDPAEIHLPTIAVASGPPYTELELADLVICFGTPADLIEVTRLITEGKWVEGLRFITRGFRFRPEEGDGNPPEIQR